LELDDNLKKLMKDLGDTINDALRDSPDINEAIRAVREAGYDVFLVLEATIGVNRRNETPAAEGETEGKPESDVLLKVNAQDMKFLKSLKIQIDDIERG
jgi:hypothetical protein